MPEDKLKKIKEAISPILEEYGVFYAGIFGSFARGEENSESDVDLLVKIRPNKKFSLLDSVDLEYKLTDKIGRKVDLATEGALSKYIKPQVFKDLITIYEGR
ncbi:MAG: polymerase, beta domain protein region protein [Candidatus Nomurabacteria bacterium GW2011_GWB1_37_5]|uniref:Polymerase, beta domain protein region protein n=1 Tax=Candidatus Nomurabacteria bacterium GW2011_GWB1_37_5 TaxID=1618742 RepID=A0A0G0K2T0_9BACT|nr:MAG: polymerase, beta domain protein region protein [Candidatus Nomurabacteria bacterium GW2011_GWB1_37_5]